MIEDDILKVNQSNLLEKPFLIIFAMEIPLNNPRAVFMRIFAYIKCLPTECKDDKFSTSRGHLLKSEALVPPMRERILHKGGSILIGIIGNSEIIS